MPSVYPTAIDTFPTLVDNVDIILATYYNELASALVAIENAIGANLSILQSTGEIRLWSGTIASIPSGWLHCDGGEVSRNTYANLFTVIGTQYGIGDGSETFNLPDTSDLFLIGAKQDDSGVAKSNIEGSLLKTGGSLTQPPTTGGDPGGASVTGGSNQNNDGHSHTFVPPFIALVHIIKT